MKKIIRSVLCIFLFVLVCTPVFASDYSSLTVTCPASDIDVRLYRVADADYNLMGAFNPIRFHRIGIFLAIILIVTILNGMMKLSQIQMVRLYFLI